jgi:RNA polymerase sigma factor (sigma-70 family)
VQGLIGPAMRRRFDTEDVVQSALKSFFKQEKLPDSVKELQTLLFLFTRCKAAKRYRYTLAERRTPLREECLSHDRYQEREQSSEAADQQWGPEEESIWQELECLRDQWRARLSPLHKKVIELNEEDVPQQEIAEQVCLADRSVRRKLREAERHLRDLLYLDRKEGIDGGSGGVRPGL